MSMKWIAAGTFLLLVTGAGAYVASQRDERAAVATESPTPAVTASAGPTAGATPRPAADRTTTEGVYLDYSPAALASARGNRVLFFHAPWCPQCRSIEAGIKRDGVPDGWTVLKVDYDSNQDLRKKYSVSLQTTFVKIDGNGDKIGDVYVAYEKPDFGTVVSNFLDD